VAAGSAPDLFVPYHDLVREDPWRCSFSERSHAHGTRSVERKDPLDVSEEGRQIEGEEADVVVWERP
jgi:hypothetical protein